MIIPSIDIRGGCAVQLVGGREQALNAGDPLAIAERFAVAGPLAVIDLDAALGTGNNTATIREIIRRHPCRVGGGIRSVEAALRWLDAGAEAVILGTAAQREILEQLPRARVMAALDAVDGEVVVEGWQKATGRGIEERLAELRDLVGGFLITFVEREGRLGGTNIDFAKKLVELAQGVRVTIAGGVTTAEEIAALDRIGADAQVGMAIYTGKLSLADAIAAPLKSDRPDGLWPTVVCDASGRALGLVYSSRESLTKAVEQRRGIYQSRTRGLWEKGSSSGNRQLLRRIDLDCDRDCLRFVVTQEGDGFCHTGQWSCFGPENGLLALARRLALRARENDARSYTAKLLRDSELLSRKLIEEAGELGDAKTRDEVIWEAADVFYFASVALQRAGVSLVEVEEALDRRSLAVTRRWTGQNEGKQGKGPGQGNSK